jgi:hypothetical protein
MLADLSVYPTTIQSLKRINSQEHIHFMRNATTRIEGKIDNIQETVNDGFQVCFFGNVDLALSYILARE